PDSRPVDAGLDAPGSCSNSSQCDGGVCVGGICCDSAPQACSGSCCPSGTVCLFDQCVTPGANCHTAADCGSGQYCETGLGSGTDAGVVDAGAACTQPIPQEGRCLPLRPTCAPDGGVSPDGGCQPACEYHPSAGHLNAVARWTWGPVASEYP